MSRKWISKLIITCMVASFSLGSAHVDAASGSGGEDLKAVPSFPDLKGHWAKQAVEKLAQAGVVTGYEDGTFHPEDPVTRAEFSALLDRVFRYAGAGPEHVDFSDVRDSDWFAQSVSDMKKAGIVEGYPDGTFQPNNRILREDALVMLQKAFRVGPSDSGAVKAFPDENAIADYAKNAVHAMASAGYLSGYDDGQIQPKGNLTRAETAALLDKLIAWISTDAGISTIGDVSGNGYVIVNQPGVTLKDGKIHGDLIVTEGVGEGDASFENVSVAGKTVIAGGGVHSVVFHNSRLSQVEVIKNYAPVRVVFMDGTTALQVDIQRQAVLELTSHTSASVVLVKEEAGGTQIVNKGTIARLKSQAEHVTVNGNAVEKGAELALPEDSSSPGGTTGTSGNPGGSESGQPGSDPWQLVWNDEFDGSSIDTSKWNVQDTGTVYNNELEYYSPNNVEIGEDGGEGVLALTAKKETYQGRSYTSGKLTSKMKGDWTYGKFEVRAKLPVQQGMWPAIWMMPTDEFDQYGPWPGSGEMDIMELTGPVAGDPAHADEYPRTVHGTIHYDIPHAQQSKPYVLPEGQTFADDYHTFSMEWLPGVIRYYVDGHKYFETSDWGTKGAGQADYYTYPAPFDRPVYMILNLAVGGDMPGDPRTDFVSDKMLVDYVRVYQYKDLDRLPDVTGKRPDLKAEPQRQPLPDGNQVYNGDFAGGTDASGVPDQWNFLLNAGGSGQVTVTDDPDKGKAAKVEITAAGSQNYSLQLTQMPMMVQKGHAYKVSFDAKGDTARPFMSKLGEYQGGWTAYSQEHPFTLTDQWQHYEYTFNMSSSSDNNARLEFNLGLDVNPVYIANVRVTETDPLPMERAFLSDGNAIYNGGFDQGTDRMEYWQFAHTAGTQASASVSNQPAFPLLDRKLQVAIANGGSSDDAVSVSQPDLPLDLHGSYQLTFEAKAEHNRSIKLALDTGAADTDRAEFEDGDTLNLTDTMSTYTKNLTINKGDHAHSSVLRFLLGNDNGQVTLDNVRLVKRNIVSSNDLVTNGDFSGNGMEGWTLFKKDWDPSDPVKDTVASVTNGQLHVSLGGTGDAEWNVQVKQQSHLNLVGGKKYRVRFDASSSVPRDIKVLVQHDGSIDNNWTAYEEQTASLSVTAATYEYLFTMPVDDSAGVLQFSMGKIGSISGPHEVILDNVSLFEVGSWNTNLIQNGDFSSPGLGVWTTYSVDPGQLSISSDNGALKIDVGTVGANSWDRQVYYEGIPYTDGNRYTLTFKAHGVTPRKMNISIGWLDTANNYAWHSYGSQIVDLGTTDQTYTMTFDVPQGTPIGRVSFELGNIPDGNAGNTSVFVDDINLVSNGPTPPSGP